MIVYDCAVVYNIVVRVPLSDLSIDPKSECSCSPRGVSGLEKDLLWHLVDSMKRWIVLRYYRYCIEWPHFDQAGIEIKLVCLFFFFFVSNDIDFYSLFRISCNGMPCADLMDAHTHTQKANACNTQYEYVR